MIRYRGKREAVLLVVLMAAFATNITLTILTIAQPDIAAYFGASAADTAWITLGPIIVSSLLVPAAGRASDMYGRKRIWIGGFVLSILGMALSGVAWSLPALIVARVITGIGTAAVMPSGLALSTAAYPPEERGTPIGWWTGTVALSPMLGVVAGGFVVESLGWRWLFFAQLPLALVALAAAFPIFENERRETPGRFDTRGSVVLGLSAFALMLGVNQGPGWGWASPATIACLVVFAVGIPIFAMIERRAENPVLPLEFFKDPVITASVLNRFMLNFVYMGGFIVLPYFLREVRGWAPAVVSLALFPRPLSMGIAGPTSGNLARRFDNSHLILGGSVAIFVSVAIFAALSASTPYWLLLIGLVSAGLGLGFSSAASTTLVTTRIDESMLGTVSGLLSITASTANSIGMAVMLSVVTGTGGTAEVRSYRTAFLLALGICLVAVAFAVDLRRHVRQERHKLSLAEDESRGAGRGEEAAAELRIHDTVA